MSEDTILTAPIDVNGIMAILPHRIPFVMVDKIVEVRPGYIVGEKCVSVNEWYFQGHFPGRPVMPGVLQIEAMAQTGAVLARTYAENKDRLIMLTGVDNARFRRPVVPGDVLRIEVTETARRRGIGKTSCRILVNGELASEAALTYASAPAPVVK